MLLMIGTMTAATTVADDLDPIHRDEPIQPTIELPSVTMNPTHRRYVMGHQEVRHVEARSKEICLRLTNQVVNDDFMKCRNGYDYKKWVVGHYDDS